MSDLEKKPFLSKRIKIIILVTVIVMVFWFVIHPFKCHLQSIWAVDDIQNNLEDYSGFFDGEVSIEDIKGIQDWIFWACFDNFPDRIDEVRMTLVKGEKEDLQT